MYVVKLRYSAGDVTWIFRYFWFPGTLRKFYDDKTKDVKKFSFFFWGFNWIEIILIIFINIR